MPSPPFSESGGGQQIIHQVGIGLRISIRDKGLYLRKTRFEPKQIMIQTANQGLAVGRFGEVESIRFQSGQNKGIDRMTVWRNRRDARVLNRLERPVVPGSLEDFLHVFHPGSRGMDEDAKNRRQKQCLVC